MRKLVIAACTAVIALAGGAALADSHGKLKLALVPKAMNNPFFDLARDGCYKAQAEEADIECVYIGPGEHTELEQLQIVQDLISQGSGRDRGRAFERAGDGKGSEGSFEGRVFR